MTTDNARAVREAAMDLYRALRRANPDAWAEVDEVEDWAYWDDIVRTAQVTLAAGRVETTPDEECGDYPAPCNCDDPKTHDGAVTTADRPSVTAAARAEADRRYIESPLAPENEALADAFIEGAEWAAGRAETTTATDEDMFEQAWEVIVRVRDAHPRAVDDAPTEDIVDALIDAGLLATARTRPTREEVLAVIPEIHAGENVRAWPEDEREMHRRPDWRSLTERNEALDLYRREKVADAVLALYADQPTEAEAGARALEQAAEWLRSDMDEPWGDRAANRLDVRAARIRAGGA